MRQSFQSTRAWGDSDGILNFSLPGVFITIQFIALFQLFPGLSKSYDGMALLLSQRDLLPGKKKPFSIGGEIVSTKPA